MYNVKLKKYNDITINVSEETILEYIKDSKSEISFIEKSIT